MSSTIPENSTEVTELKQFLEKWMNLAPQTTHFYRGDNLEDVTEGVRTACSGNLEQPKNEESGKRSLLQRLFRGKK